jgi:hypothetical protein
MKHPQLCVDIDPWSSQLFAEISRRMTPGQRLAKVFELSEYAFKMAEFCVRERFPLAKDREIFLRTAATHLTREEMIRAYGWDPSTPT